MTTIRPYGGKDFAACAALWERCGLTVWYNDPARDIALWQQSPNSEIFVAESAGTLSGTICCGHDGHRGWLYYVAVDPSDRHHGLGRRLVRHAEAWLHKQGIRKVELMVRESNRQVIGFYNALGYAVTPRAVMARWLELPAEPPADTPLPLDLALAAGRDSKVRFTITYLEMTARPAIAPVHPPIKTKFALMLAERPTVAFYRYLYNTVGGDWRWWLRRQMSDEELAGILADDRVEVFVLYVDGAPAGYFELDRREEPTIDLAYFGLMPHVVGRGLGRFLLYSAIEQAWSYDPERLTVNTNTMDHPRALPLYQKMGFVPYRQEEEEIFDPAITGVIPA
ncbi:GNAT family acetyltransferase [Pelagibius sp. 7325]|uniref:GNAT family acetyltransferase n=1 Tax=Pelagibius sp. 7325 TaxID=3131994 RepID=UPI0030EF6AEA